MLKLTAPSGERSKGVWAVVLWTLVILIGYVLLLSVTEIRPQTSVASVHFANPSQTTIPPLMNNSNHTEERVTTMNSSNHTEERVTTMNSSNHSEERVTTMNSSNHTEVWVTDGSVPRVQCSHRNLLIGAATGYDNIVLTPFINSYMTYTTPCDDVWLIVRFPPNSVSVIRPGNLRFLNVDTLQPSEIDPRGVATDRFYMVRELTRNLSDTYKYVMTCDVRDVIFQDDPFAPVEGQLGVFVVQEVFRLSEELKNQQWVRSCCGAAEYEQMMLLDPFVICSGFSIGSVVELHQFVGLVYENLYRSRHDRLCEDQGAFEYLVWTGATEAKFNFSVTQLSPYTSRYAHMLTQRPGQVREMSVDVFGRLLNDNGDPYAMLHQFDRDGKLWDGWLVRPRYPALYGPMKFKLQHREASEGKLDFEKAVLPEPTRAVNESAVGTMLPNGRTEPTRAVNESAVGTMLPNGRTEPTRAVNESAVGTMGPNGRTEPTRAVNETAVETMVPDGRQ